MAREVFDRETVLLRTTSDIGGLPLDPREAFLLTQIDGRLSLEELSEVVGIEWAATVRLAERFIALGIVSVTSGSTSSRRPIPREEADDAILRSGRRLRFQMPCDPRADTPVRIDPRAESENDGPRSDPRAESAGPSVPRRRSSSRSHPAVTGRSTTPVKTVAAKRTSTKRPPPMPTAPPASRGESSEACELDATTLAKITGLDQKLGSLDHYALLGVAHDAEKREIKRAYFGLAQTFHPDRYFGKKLGPARAAIDRIFVRLTEAHDTLVDRTKRSTYDSRLGIPPRRPSRRLSKSGISVTGAKASRRSSGGMRAVKATMPAATTISAATRPAPETGLSTPSIKPAARPAVTAAPGPPMASAPPASPIASAPPSAPLASAPPSRSEDPASARAAAERLRRLQAAARQIEVQQHADVFIRAAEEALRKQDPIGAANNFRLALEAVEDPYVRHRFEQAEALARVRRQEKLAKQQAADGRRAGEAKPSDGER